MSGVLHVLQICTIEEVCRAAQFLSFVLFFLPYETDHAAAFLFTRVGPLVSCTSCVFPSYEMSSHCC